MSRWQRDSSAPYPWPADTLVPDDPHLARALGAIDRGRFEDAEKSLRESAEAGLPTRAWQSLLRGRIALAKGHPAEAENLFLTAASLAGVTAAIRPAPDPAPTELLRIAAAALLYAGLACRRQDRPEHARQLHEAAEAVFDFAGTPTDRWAIAVELGLDFDLAGDPGAAETCFGRAIEAAGEAGSAQLLAIASTHLSQALEHSGRYPDAVAAAREARGHWFAHNPGSVEVARADARLGAALLRWGEHLMETDTAGARAGLTEAESLLITAADSLLAFGSENADDARACRERADLAGRLLLTVAD